MLRCRSLSKRMRALDLIRKKRDSGELSREEINFLVSGYTRDEIPDYQMAAWLMAAWIRGLNHAEIAALTEVMLHSGEVVNHSEIPGKKVDKHSTGGIGDKTSLILAPIVAAGGLTVPMISGRGLGHTGGTLDKLEAIPGFNVNLSLDEFRWVLRECGMGLIGQTAEIAPADKKIYALRDVTSTVENIGLICASIMSKKLAEGIDALVLDVKTGSGAFMKKEEDAIRLAEVMVETGKSMGKKVVALITGMDQPLGRMASHSASRSPCWAEAARRKKTASSTPSGSNSTNASATAWKKEDRWPRFITIAMPNLPKQRTASRTVITLARKLRARNMLWCVV